MTKYKLKQRILRLTNSETAWNCVDDYLTGKHDYATLACGLKGIYYAPMVKEIIAMVNIYKTLGNEGK